MSKEENNDAFQRLRKRPANLNNHLEQMYNKFTLLQNGK